MFAEQAWPWETALYLPANNWDSREEQRPDNYPLEARWVLSVQWAIKSAWQPGLTCRILSKTGEHNVFRVGD